MSQSLNTNVINFCDVCNLSFETKKGLYRHQSYDLKHKDLLAKTFESDDEISERLYDQEEDDYVYKPIANTKDIIETKTKPKAEDRIYSKIKYECKECHEQFRNKIGLTTHSYSHNRK